MELLLNPAAWIALFTLALLEIVLGIDNIVFLSIMSNKLPQHEQAKARTLGLTGAMVMRICLLFCISLLMQLKAAFWGFTTSTVSVQLSGHSLIMFFGGLFLLYKAVKEIHHKMEGVSDNVERSSRSKFLEVVAMIILLDIVFSFDSVLTAVGLVSFTEFGYGGAMAIMVGAIVIAIAVMLLFSAPVSKFVNTHPSIQVLGLSLLILIGVMLLTEAAHSAQLVVMGDHISALPKGYIYFAIFFAIMVEYFQFRVRKKTINPR